MGRRLALLPGGARGMGRALALALAGRGWDVAVAYRTSASDGAALVRDAQALGARALALAADVTVPEEADRLVQAVQDALGPVDALVHCVGPFVRVPLLEETPQGWQDTLASNLSSYFHVARLVAPGMAERGWGRILAFGIVNAERLGAQPNLTAHVIAKAGVITLTRTLAKMLAGRGVTANVISPGFIDSGSVPLEEFDALVKQIPAGHPGTSADAVSLALYLLSDEARYVTGAVVPLAGGWGL